MNKSLFSFFKRLIIFVLIFFVIDRAVGYTVQYLYFNKENGNSAVATYAISKTHEDILVYGSSRAAHHYDCRVLTDSLGFSSYNCGKDGANIIYAETILPAALKRHKPQVIILDFIANDLASVGLGNTTNRRTDFIASMLLPYVNTNKEIEKAVYEIDPMEVYKSKLSLMYAYNSQIMQVFANKAGAAHNIENGFQPLKGSKVKRDPAEYKDFSPVDTFAKNKFEAFVQTATGNKIPLYVIVSPMYVQPFKSTPSLDSARSVLSRYNISLWDYSQDTTYKKKELFYDDAHMNTKGAAMFSAEIAERIKVDILKRKLASE